MNFQFHHPKGILKDFVEYIAFLSGTGSGTGVAFQRMHQVIIINIGANFTVSDIYAKTPEIKLCLNHPAIKQTPNFLSMQRETFLQFISL